jgi:hypothetical protein
MARQLNDHDLTPLLEASKDWITRCLIGDESLFDGESRPAGK